MKNLVTNYLLNLGFVPNKLGYRYIFDIIMMGVENEQILPLKHIAYKKLSDNYGKTVSTIEKDIQNAISTAWLKGNVDTIYREFGETIDVSKGKPSNKQFLMTAILKLQSMLN